MQTVSGAIICNFQEKGNGFQNVHYVYTLGFRRNLCCYLGGAGAALTYKN